SEQINGKAVPQSDFFALGRTFVYLLTGKSPDSFSEDSRNGELIWRDHAAGISPKLVQLIDYLMAPFPGNRPPDTQEILQKLAEFDTASPAFRQNNVNNQSANNYNQISPTIASESPAVNQGGNSPPYAVLKRRTLAYFIDILITVFILFIAAFIMDELLIFNDVIILIGWIIPTWLYFALLESSVKQATLGKMVCKIVVHDLKGKRISFWRATGRFLVKAFFTLLTLIGFGLIDLIFVLFNKDKRSLHDILAGTLVSKKPSP
ncbi:RDD family protein, partial [Nodularia spumigena]